MKLAFRPVGKKAPPRPRRFDSMSSWMTACGSCARLLELVVAAGGPIGREAGQRLAVVAGEDERRTLRDTHGGLSHSAAPRRSSGRRPVSRTAGSDGRSP